MITIRRAVRSDLPYLYEICFRTAFLGESAEGLTDDRFKVGHYFVAPYLWYEAGIVFVATKAGIPCGYVSGVSDTIRYTEWLNSEWLPSVRRYYSLDDDGVSEFDAFLNRIIQSDTVRLEGADAYPAHLHIDLLPEIRRQGIGRKLMQAFFNECRNEGVGSAHLVVAKANTGAVDFYKRLGMKIVVDTGSALCMGRNSD